MRARDRARANGNSIGGPHLPLPPASTTAVRTARVCAGAVRRKFRYPADREDLSLKDAALKVGYRTGRPLDK